MRDYELATQNKEAWMWIRSQGHLDFVNKAIECDQFAQGIQWSDAAKAKLKARRKPYLTIPKILATVSSLSAQHLSQRGDVSFRSSAGGSPETARALDKLWLNFSYSQNREALESQMFQDGVIRSRGFLDLRIDFNESMQGEPRLTYLNSKDVGLFPGDTGLDPDGWTGVMITRWLSPRDISEIYKVPLKDIMQFADTPELDSDYVDWRKDAFGQPMYGYQVGSMEQRSKYRLVRVLERQEWEYRNAPCFVDQTTGETRQVPEEWDHERISMAVAQHGYGVIDRRVRKINWVVTCGDVLLHNAISPYRHFTPIAYFPYMIGGRPVGIVEQLIDVQNLLNKTLSQELHIVAGIANSGYKVQQGALANMTTEQLQERGGEDGIVIEVTGDLNKVEKLQPNQVPTGLDRLSYTANEMMQQISLVNDSMQGLNRADEAGKAIERKAIQGSSALAPIFASLDQSRRILARNWLDLTQQFITEERVFHVTSRARTAETEQVVVNQEQFDGSFLNDLTVGEYSIQLTDVRSRDNYDQNQYDIMMQMVREGAPIPWSEVVNSLTLLENKDEIVQFLKAQEGRSDPTEEDQKRKEMEQRLAEADAADKEASAAVKQAQAQKAMVEAQKAGEPDNSGQIEMMKAQQMAEIKQQELEAKNQQALMKAQLDAQIAQQELMFKQKMQEEELRFMREKHELEIMKLRATIEAQQVQAQVQTQTAHQQAEMKQQEVGMKLQATQQQMALQHESEQQKMSLQQEQAGLQLENAKQTSAMQMEQAQQSHEQKLKMAARAAKAKPKVKPESKEK